MSRHGKVRQVLQPGAPGARRWHERYGDQLICVRYRYDDAGQLRQTTVEIVVDSRPWLPPAARPAEVRVDYEETALRAALKRSGAQWDPVRRRWRTNRGVIQALHLENRLDPPPPPL